MGHKKPRHNKAPVEDEAMSDSEIEVADIEALARSKLGANEMILGDRGAEDDEENETRLVLNKPMIAQKLKDIEYKIPEGAKRVPWIDTLQIDGQEELPKGLTSKDGVKLESSFLNLSTVAAKEAYRRLRVMKVPCTRPSDFYAEMLRPDATMYKVRKWASEETRRINIVEDRKKAQAAKKFQKKAKTTKAAARATEKRNTLDDIQAWKEAGKVNNGTRDEDGLDDIISRHGSKKRKADEMEDGKGKGKGKDGRPKKSKKREALDKKYGHGGKKKASKRNDAKSTHDFSASPWGKKMGKGKGKGGGKGGGKGKKMRVRN